LAQAEWAAKLARLNAVRPLRALALTIALLSNLTAASAFAQTAPAPAAHPSAAAPAAPATTAPVTADDLQNLVNTIQDPTARKKLVTELQGLIAAQRGVQKTSPSHALRNFFASLAEGAHAIGDEVLAAATVAVDAPRIVSWIRDQASNEQTRHGWYEITMRLAVILGLALVADWLVWLLMRAPARRFGARSGEALAWRLVYLLIDAAFEALPIAAFAAVAFFVLPLAATRFVAEQVAMTVISAYLWSRIVAAAARVVLLSPNALTLYPLGEETRNYLYIWVRRFANFGFYGFAIAGCSWWLHVPGAIYAILLRIVVLVLGILAIIFVLQNKTTVATWMRGSGEPATGRGRGWRLLRQRLAAVWHILAIIVIVGTFGVSALHIEGGFLVLLRATLLSIVVVLAAALAVQFINRASKHGFAIKPELKARFPTLESRTNRYIPILTTLASLAIYVVAALALLQAWGIDAFVWVQAAASNSACLSVGSSNLGCVQLGRACEGFRRILEIWRARRDSNSRPPGS